MFFYSKVNSFTKYLYLYLYIVLRRWHPIFFTIYFYYFVRILYCVQKKIYIHIYVHQPFNKCNRINQINTHTYKYIDSNIVIRNSSYPIIIT